MLYCIENFKGLQFLSHCFQSVFYFVLFAEFSTCQTIASVWAKFQRSAAYISLSMKSLYTFWQGKTLTKWSFQSFGKENNKFIHLICCLLKWVWIKYRRITFVLSYSLKFCPCRILRYHCYCCNKFGHIIFSLRVHTEWVADNLSLQ